MSLFVCQCCKDIEDTDNVYPTHKHQDRPNMTLEDMYGNGKELIDIRTCEDYHIEMADGDMNFIPLDYKYPDMVMMLCSECNTGEWLSPFPKAIANEHMLEISTKNLYSFLENLSLSDIDKMHRNFIGH